MPANHDVVLREWQSFTVRDADLQVHQVEPGDQFGHRMFHLQTRIHFQEVEILLLVDQKLDCAGVGVARSLRDPDSHFAHPAPHGGIHDRRRRFLQHFLMTSLNRTLTLAQPDRIPVLVG